jgi:hypothetical protein
MTTRLRAGFFIDSKMKEDKQYYFGYITHAGLEYDIAIAMPTSKLSKYIASDKMLVNFEGMEFKLGILQTYSDNDGNDIYSVKAFIASKLCNLIIYPSQYQDLIKLGHHINTYQNSLVLESFVNLNQEQ